MRSTGSLSCPTLPLRRGARALCAALAVSAVGSALARPENITAGELALVPQFCQDVQSINGWTKEKGTRSPRAEHWLSMMGETFWAMHHFCYGLIQRQRSRAPGLTPQMRDFLLREVIDEHKYVIRNSPADFVMRPEIFYRLGEAHAELGEHMQAIDYFEKSNQAKSDYWPAYAGWATSLAKTLRRAEAHEVLNRGLKEIPDNPQLLRLREELQAGAPRQAAMPRR